MALTWDVTKIAESVRIGTRYNEKDEPFEGLSLLTEQFIWLTLSTGIGEITEANAAEVFARIQQVERVYGATLRVKEGEDWIDKPVTMQDVADHIGLKTNASFKDEPRAAWLKRFYGQQMDAAAQGYKRNGALAKIVAAPAKSA